MNRPEPIELENNLGPDAVTGEINRVPWMAYDVDEMDLYIAEKDAEIAELKKKLMPCLNGDCILTCEVVEKYGKENAELKQKLEDVQASHYAEMVDAGMRERRLRRALWLARAELCHRLDVDRYLRKHLNSWYNENLLTFNDACVAMEVKMCDAERKCRAKAEEFK